MPATRTRQRILDAARALFDTGGVERVSVRQVAARVELTPMAIYRHFPDRARLIDALVLEALDRWAERVQAIRHDDPLRWLAALCDDFLDFALEEPARFEAAFLVRSSQARRFPDDFAAGRSPAGALWTARLEELQRRGWLTPHVRPVEVGFTLWALCQGLVTLHRAGRFTGDEAQFRAFFRKSVRRCLASFVDRGAA